MGQIRRSSSARRYQLEPFHAETDEKAGDNKRTRLSIFAMGVPFAGAGGNAAGVNVAALVQVDAVDPTGRVVGLEVEYAGPALGFFSLDQINAVVPAGLAGIGLQRRVTADGQVSNSASVMLTHGSIEPAYGSVFRF